MEDHEQQYDPEKELALLIGYGAIRSLLLPQLVSNNLLTKRSICRMATHESVG